MEPVPVTRRVRRTVRMAVALVVGQAMLCALIGWLTLGRHRPEPARPPGAPVVDQLAIPPLTTTAASAPPPSRSAISATRQSRQPSVVSSARPAPVRSTSAAPAPPAASPEPILAPPDDPAMVPPVPPVPSPSTPKTPLLPSSPASSPVPSASPGVVQDPVRVGDECHPVGSYGRTAEGDLVRCVRDWRHGPRWKIV
ncbi:hypothetical protein Aab01nite_19790 [Paractinoplanes abujensis]|uniref:Uncharacterized protein n=1 Tax=Paractinoplanes abujensis TaxID=882441 RepID=A0A7W7CYT2_9ACTN|nr:hypothetical protein [Actinoplanes abujensis]MBB4697137.1 hypothetical protein [Actinoplanes abujensis]GID18389.1 hypothetical protein Aab01nite_19790 [Actinoplanes abujensis]